MVSPAELASMKSALENALTLCAAERRSASDYVALAQAVIRLTACVPGSDAYVQERVALAELLGQSNTYSTWSLSLKSSALLHRRLLYTASATQPDLSPAELGVTETSTPAFLKAPDNPTLTLAVSLSLSLTLALTLTLTLTLTLVLSLSLTLTLTLALTLTLTLTR
jgi:hypothetical protein